MPFRSFFLFTPIVLGLVLQQGHSYAFLIQYILMAMLFLSWIDTRLSFETLTHPKLWWIVAVMVGLAIAAFTGFSWIDPQLALIAGILALTPTALAAPVVTNLLRGQVEFVSASVLITNLLVAVLLPVLLPIMLDLNPAESGFEILLNTLWVIALPLFLAQGMRSWMSSLARQVRRLKPITFYLWLIGLYFASAKAGYFIRHNDQSLQSLMPIGVVALVLCTLNFALGRWLGRPSLVQETGQALGQKNTMLAVWVCLTFLAPTLALGPMFYIVFQNLYNAYLMSQTTHR